MAKLTLSVDEVVVESAKRYAANRGTSVSWLVERYLRLLARPVADDNAAPPPILARLRGSLKGARPGRERYSRYLERKYK